MARDLDKDWADGFKEYTAEYQDAEGDTHTSPPVRAHVVTDREFAGRELLHIGGNVHSVRVGDVVTETSRPGVYDTVDAEGWKKAGYGQVSPPKGDTPPKSDTPPSDSPSQSGVKK